MTQPGESVGLAELTGRMANEVARAERRCWMEGWRAARYPHGSEDEAREAWELARNDAQLPSYDA